MTKSSRTIASLSFIAGATFLAAASYQVFCPKASLLGRIPNHGPRTRRCVAIVFDRQPNPLTGPVTRLLHELEAPATFFVEENRLRSDPKAAILIKPFETGIHGVNYRPLVMRREADLHREIRRACLAASDLQGRAPAFLMPPLGWKDLRLVRIARAFGLMVVNPSTRLAPEAGKTGVDQVLARLRPGDIVLVPWRAGTHDPTPTLDAVRRLVTGARDAGLAPWGLSALLSSTRSA